MRDIIAADIEVFETTEEKSIRRSDYMPVPTSARINGQEYHLARGSEVMVSSVLGNGLVHVTLTLVARSVTIKGESA